MKVTLESTSKLITLVVDGHDVPARIWEGQTESGIPIFAYITRVVPEVDPRDTAKQHLFAEFEQELKETAAPRPVIEAIPLRMIL